MQNLWTSSSFPNFLNQVSFFRKFPPFQIFWIKFPPFQTLWIKFPPFESFHLFLNQVSSFPKFQPLQTKMKEKAADDVNQVQESDDDGQSPKSSSSSSLFDKENARQNNEPDSVTVPTSFMTDSIVGKRSRDLTEPLLDSLDMVLTQNSVVPVLFTR